MRLFIYKKLQLITGNMLYCLFIKIILSREINIGKDPLNENLFLVGTSEDINVWIQKGTFNG